MAVSALKVERVRKGLTQRELSRRTGVHAVTISATEGRKLIPPQRHREALAQEMGGTEADFFEPSGLARLAV